MEHIVHLNSDDLQLLKIESAEDLEHLIELPVSSMTAVVLKSMIRSQSDRWSHGCDQVNDTVPMVRLQILIRNPRARCVLVFRGFWILER